LTTSGTDWLGGKLESGDVGGANGVWEGEKLASVMLIGRLESGDDEAVGMRRGGGLEAVMLTGRLESGEDEAVGRRGEGGLEAVMLAGRLESGDDEGRTGSLAWVESGVR
jgi:hypothetical protein